MVSDDHSERISNAHTEAPTINYGGEESDDSMQQRDAVEADLAPIAEEEEITEQTCDGSSMQEGEGVFNDDANWCMKLLQAVLLACVTFWLMPPILLTT